MSSAGQAIGGVVGAITGFIGGGPTGALYGAQLGMGIGGLIDPPKGPNLQGPRLSDLAQQASTYGSPIPRVYGTVALYGNIIWLQGDSLTEISTTTESGGKGGPTSTQTTYAYYATFAVALCQGPIAGVRRIWVGADLIYDAGSDDVEAVLVSNESAELFTLYLGTDTQLADPLIQADKGVNDTPAYRGIAYLVFDTYPLAKHGNSLLGAQVKVEVVSSGSSGIATIIKEQYLPAGTLMHSPSYFLPLTKDVANKTIAIVQARDGGGGFDDWKTMKFTAFGENPRPIITPYPGVRYSSNGSGEGDFTTRLYSSDHQTVYIDGVPYVTGLPVPGTTYNCETIVTADAIWTYAKNTSTSNHYVTAVNKTLNYVMLVLEQGNGASGEGHIAYDAATDQVLILRDDHFDKYDAATAEILGTVNFSSALSSFYGSSFSVTDGVLQRVWHSSAYNALAQYDLSSGALIQNIDLPSYGGSGSVYGWVSGNVLVRMSSIGTSATARRITLIKLPTLDASSLIPLADIVEAECLRSNLLEAGDIDVTALTDNVRGYRIANTGALRAALTPLQGVFPFDVVQSGYQITFVPRGGASVDSIPEIDLGAGTGGPVPLFTLSREMDSQLPRSVHIKYLDAAREYDIGEQYAERLSTDAVNRLDLEVSVVLTADEAVQVAERLLYLYWLERSDIGPLTLPPEYRHLEPADVVTVAYDDDSYEVRLTGINYRADGCIECTGKLNSATIYTSTAVADTGAVTGTTLSVAGPTVVVLLDIPLMRDDDDTAGFPVAMCGYLDGWPGGVLYRSEDDGQSWVDIVASVSPGAVIGYATTALSVHGGMMMDKASTLTVRLYSGQLASVTEAQMFNGANWFAYGDDGRWEIIAAQTAALQGDGSYILSDFMRGRNGTEWATGLHAVNDRIVLLSATALKFVSVNSGSIGSERLFRGITFGKALDSDSGAAFTYNGVNLECLSPVYLNGSRHPTTNDWTLTWIRRTRVGGEWRDYVDAALGESTESYEVDIYADGTYSVVKRTLSASTATVAYTSAQQVTDFGSNQATLYVRVYQLSATVGRGYALQTSITR